ncbi:hypothetical protein CTRI78_v003412 [Colletotrichum trifolii]|uniref:Uncharacterized protein n=1 Tax=Colletotrichum trifolii TaxID=5466 RepID=A0A4R8RRY6_COLTR|nr:hypothetical protein CTRI78_v003412 [Colletotrichum trifolii]
MAEADSHRQTSPTETGPARHDLPVDKSLQPPPCLCLRLDPSQRTSSTDRDVRLHHMADTAARCMRYLHAHAQTDGQTHTFSTKAFASGCDRRLSVLSHVTSFGIQRGIRPLPCWKPELEKQNTTFEPREALPARPAPADPQRLLSESGTVTPIQPPSANLLGVASSSPPVS